MPAAPPERPDAELVREQAAEWFALMRGPDASLQRAAFEMWLSQHPLHRQAYDRMVMRWDQARLVGHTETGRTRTGLPPRRAPNVRFAAVAALLVAALLGGSAWLLMSGRTAPVAPSAVVATELETPVGAIRRLPLPDGSVVTLDTRTRLQVAFGSAERRIVLIAGRARFEVAHDAARPFVVSAGEGEVVATGTVFDVSLIGNRPQVRLIKGSVEVRRRGAGVSARPEGVARLSAGQSIALGVAHASPSLAVGDERWVSGVLSFDGVPLDAALTEANSYSTTAIRLDDPALGMLRVTGGFKAGDQQGLAYALAASFGLEAVHDPAGNFLLRRRRK